MPTTARRTDSMTSDAPDTTRTVTVCAPSRLHLGFLDPSGTLGQRFGGFGITINEFDTALTLSAAPLNHPLSVVTAAADTAQSEIDRAQAHLQALIKKTSLHTPLSLHLLRTPPAHAGFGSGTQLALAVGHAFAKWHALNMGTADIAHALGRGLRSGVGIAGFDQGGLLVDGGPQANGLPAPLLARMAMPDEWRALIVTDPRCQGLSGEQEKQALAALPPLPQAHAADICHHILMRVLPGVACADFTAFASGVGHIQQVLGAHFATAQGGQSYTSNAVGRMLKWMASTQGTQGMAIGQSSWGPTGFSLMPSLAQAQRTVEVAQTEGVIDPALQWRIVRFNNVGAQWHTAAPCAPAHLPTRQAAR